MTEIAPAVADDVAGSQLPGLDPHVPDSELWIALREQGSQEAREALFMRHLPFARREANRTLRLHGIVQVELADIFQSACVGLMQSIDRFDPQKGAAFTTYAAYRIQGAVLNSLETYSEVQQQIQAHARKRAERVDSLRVDDVTPTSPRERIVDALAAISMGLAVGFMLEESGVYADPDSPALTPDSGYQTLAWKQLRETLQQHVDALPEKERRVLAYHYFNGLDFEQVALLMGLSKGRVSQLHKAGLTKLRELVPRIEHFSSA